MEDLRRAKAILQTGGYTCVLCQGEFFFTATARGVKPLLDWLDSGMDLRGFSAADKVVGRATAFLYRLLGVREVHALVMSTPAREALEAGGIAASCDKEVKSIINRRGDGPCPFETAVLGIQDAAEALTAIRKQQLRMRLPQTLRPLVAGRDFSLDRFGLSGATIALFEDMVLKCEPCGPNGENELALLRWLQDKLPVPRLLAEASENGFQWTLMSRLPGVMSCDMAYRADPWKLTQLLARGLRMLWAVDCTGCPADQSLSAKFARLEAGALSMDETVTGFPSPAHLLDWLRTNKPAEDRVLTHGDYCLPNIFLSDDSVCGFLDLGRCGVGDPWVDIAICWRSLRDNFGGHYGEAVPGYDPDYLFEVLQLEKDPKKLEYYLNLDELF